MAGDLTPGDPLGEPAPRPQGAPPPPAPGPEAPPAGGAYGGGPVPPGAYAPRQRFGTDPELAGAPAASWLQRAGAAILDSLIVLAGAAVVLGILAAIFLGALAIDSPAGFAGAVVIGFFALIGIAIAGLLYAPVIMARTNGKTVGKMATGCRVVRKNGRPVDFLWAAYREVLIKSLAVGIVGSITAGIGYLVNYLWPLFDDQDRALHDIVVDSRVIKD
ncbi:MAG TPA: RDD family protein [Solirubrobacteraceae bacterium]|nr:RDD family protein [Solirubrobacteraceae bacterium]